MSYFHETAPKRWSITEAYGYYKNKKPDLPRRTILHEISSDLKNIQHGTGAAAKKASAWVKNWSVLVRRIPQEATESPVEPSGTTHTTNNVLLFSFGSDSTVTTAPSLPTPTATPVSGDTTGSKRRNSQSLHQEGKRRRVEEETDVGYVSESDEDDDNPLNHIDFTVLHKYSLERCGIIQYGRNVEFHYLVPDHVYEQLPITKPTKIPRSNTMHEYLRSVLYSDKYGTPEATELIFKKPDTKEKLFQFVQRMLFQYSENIHDKTLPARLEQSEATYCHYVLWPLMRITIKFLTIPEDIKVTFKVGEVQLAAAPGTDDYNRYLADATGSLEAGGLEFVLMEASGAYGHINRTKHAYDHVKGAFGCVEMLRAIFKKYEFGERKIAERISVVFLHASGKDKCLRAWVMRPVFRGKHASFERVLKCEIDQTPSSVDSVLKSTRFFWQLKGLLEESVSAIAKLNKSHVDFLMDEDDTRESISEMLRPVPLKPKKNDTAGMAGLDPSSSL